MQTREQSSKQQGWNWNEVMMQMGELDRKRLEEFNLSGEASSWEAKADWVSAGTRYTTRRALVLDALVWSLIEYLWEMQHDHNEIVTRYK